MDPSSAPTRVCLSRTSPGRGPVRASALPLFGDAAERAARRAAGARVRTVDPVTDDGGCARAGPASCSTGSAMSPWSRSRPPAWSTCSPGAGGRRSARPAQPFDFVAPDEPEDRGAHEDGGAAGARQGRHARREPGGARIERPGVDACCSHRGILPVRSAIRPAWLSSRGGESGCLVGFAAPAFAGCALVASSDRGGSIAPRRSSRCATRTHGAGSWSPGRDGGGHRHATLSWAETQSARAVSGSDAGRGGSPA
jgi:hypothetical protein